MGDGRLGLGAPLHMLAVGEIACTRMHGGHSGPVWIRNGVLMFVFRLSLGWISARILGVVAPGSLLPASTTRYGTFSVFALALFGFPSLLTLWLSLSSSLFLWGLTGKLAFTLASLFTLLLLAAVVIRLWSYMYICVSECYHA